MYAHNNTHTHTHTPLTNYLLCVRPRGNSLGRSHSGQIAHTQYAAHEIDGNLNALSEVDIQSHTAPQTAHSPKPYTAYARSALAASVIPLTYSEFLLIQINICIICMCMCCDTHGASARARIWHSATASEECARHTKKVRDHCVRARCRDGISITFASGVVFLYVCFSSVLVSGCWPGNLRRLRLWRMYINTPSPLGWDA